MNARYSPLEGLFGIFENIIRARRRNNLTQNALTLNSPDDWSATFSCNTHGETWPFVTHGYTPEHTRLNLQGQSRLLDQIVSCVLKEEPLGGRFRIDSQGVYLVGAGDRRIARFVRR